MTAGPRGTPPPLDLRAVERELTDNLMLAPSRSWALLAHARALRTEYDDVGDYIGHKADCTYENAAGDVGDACTCGFAAMKARVRAVLAAAQDGPA